MTNRTITGTIDVWISDSSSIGPQDLINMPDDKLVKRFSYYMSDMSAYGCTRVAEAQVTITLPDTATLVANKIAALKAEENKIQADAQAKVTNIQRQIQKLLAIDYTETK